MYRTSIATAPAGPFHGPLVVSMRPMTPENAIRAIQITTRFPAVHGAPVHIGKPELIGISDLMKPDYGEAVPVNEDEIPVFWACGVTPQSWSQPPNPNSASPIIPAACWSPTAATPSSPLCRPAAPDTPDRLIPLPLAGPPRQRPP